MTAVKTHSAARQVKEEVLTLSDNETNEVLGLLKGRNLEVNNLGGLARGIRFGDLEVGRRTYNHNSRLYYADAEYYIHQWKKTNDLSKEHPQGTHIVTKSYPEFLKKLQHVLENQEKRYK